MLKKANSGFEEFGMSLVRKPDLGGNSIWIVFLNAMVIIALKYDTYIFYCISLITHHYSASN